MPKKSTQLEQLSEKIHIAVEEMRNLRMDILDHMFLEIYAEQASQLTDTRQQKKVLHPLKDVVGIVFFAVLAGNDEWTDIADFAVDKKRHCKNIWNCLTGFPPMIRYKEFFSSCVLMSCRTCW